MRTKEEIRQAIGILTHKGDGISLVMAETLREGMTEQQVFRKYIMEISEADRDEAVFFAARDSARFRSGQLGLEELIPDVQSMTAGDFCAAGVLGVVGEDGGDTIVLSREEFDKLLERIERLEQWTGLRRKAKPGNCLPGTLPAGADMSDMMTQNEACRYLKCGKNTIKGYASRGLIHSYRQGRYTYYSRREMERNIIGQREEESL
ncbi:helix-turn-helix domain-containing protein [Bacteroides heparinolyticus]|uniref:helix-turn-helix domain-containing protein n=1 Tax=Prevotella heparinolytica TaxID=28113 RepID=UPI0023EFBFF2|nr:helix-turn-helix domain-containing protein [Bacteroides heparinolyticus]